jgi:hypothetical protein
MKMKQHILAALNEELNEWEALLGNLSEAQITSPVLSSDWTIKDIIVHLWAWQQRSIARVEAALLDREPEFPRWHPEYDPEMLEKTDQVNAWIYSAYRDLPWSKVHQDWKEGFQHFLDSAQGISEKDLLDGSKYPWLEGYTLAFILIASYDHHQEHLEILQAWLNKQVK